MFTSELLLIALAVVLRILVTAAIGAVCARYILQIRPTPYVRVFLIAAAAHLLAKAADEPLGVVARCRRPDPGLVLLVLSYLVFKPTVLYERLRCATAGSSVTSVGPCRGSPPNPGRDGFRARAYCTRVRPRSPVWFARLLAMAGSSLSAIVNVRARVSPARPPARGRGRVE